MLTYLIDKLVSLLLWLIDILCALNEQEYDDRE